MKKNEICWACGTYGGEEAASNIVAGKLKEGNHLENLIVDERVILKCIFKK